MSSTNETGHAKNVSNFKTLISFIAAYGSNYNPSRNAIQLPSLIIKVAEAEAAIDNVNASLANLNQAIAARAIAFEPLKRLGTKLLSSLKSTDASLRAIKYVSSLNKKLNGRRIGHKLTEEEKLANKAKGKEIVQISVSQQSFDSLLDTFQMIIQFLAIVKHYAPNETELQVATLKAQYITLLDLNKLVTENNAKISTARRNRNEILYHPVTGLKTIALASKNYLKSLYGINSAEYKQVSALPFTSYKY